MEQSLDDLLAKFGPTEQLSGTLKRALSQARSQGHHAMTLEHLLLSLCDDDDASIVLQACNIDLDRLKADMSSYLQRTRGAGQANGAGANPTAHDDLVRILRVAHAAAQQRQRAPNGGLVLAAIVGDGRSPAANMLRSQGLTFEAAVKALQSATLTATSSAAPGPASESSEAAPSEDPIEARDTSTEPEREVERSDTDSPPPPGEASPSDLGGARGPLAPELSSPEPSAVRPDTVEARSSEPARLQAPLPQPSVASQRPLHQTTGQPRLEPEPSPKRQPSSMREILDDARRKLDAAKPNRREAQSPSEPLARLNRPPASKGSAAPDPVSSGSVLQDAAAAEPKREPATKPAVLARAAEASPPVAEPAGKTARHPGSNGVSRSPAEKSDLAKEAGIAPLHDLPPVTHAPPSPSPQPRRDVTGPPPVPPATPPTAPPVAPPTAPPTAPPPRQPQAARPRQQAPSPQTPLPRVPQATGSTAPASQPAPPQAPRAPAGQRQLVTTPPELKPPVQHASPSLPGAPDISRAVPKTMRRTRTEIIEVRISRREIDAIVAGPVDPITGRPVARRGHVVSRAMTLRMRSGKESFYIETMSPETQWVEQRQGLLLDDSVQWRWAVTPRLKGSGDLQVLGSVRTVHSDGQAIDTALPTEKISVRVKGKPGALLAALGAYTVAVGLGAALAFGLPLIWPRIAPFLGM